MAYPSNLAMKSRGVVPYVDFDIDAGGSSNETDITMQFKDSDGNDVADTFLFDFWMADNQDGSSIADDATSAHSDGGSGDLVGTLDEDVHATVLTNSSGEAVITVTDTSKSAKYACVRDPRTGWTNVSRVLATADYA